ncbi:MAG: xylose isomerase, partial [Proteobacteria bacterium]|nr:xylose isomerase [Pseudomonadota bacterium]
MAEKQSYHSICRWTFHAGKGGFLPENMIPAWSSQNMDTVGVVKLIKNKIAPRLPETVQLGIELHYDYEVDEKNAPAVADALVDSGIYLAMITPGAHRHFAYGGIASLDKDERKAAEEMGIRTVDISYSSLKKAWHPDLEKSPAIVFWNGSYGYDLASVGIGKMYQNLKESVANFCRYEAKKGGQLFIGIEPKPNEGHPALLLPTVASAILFWRKLEEEFSIALERKGINKEFGHSEMIGLDHVYDTVEE